MSHQYYFEKLNVWMESKNFAIEVYKITDKFPNDERYGLISQLRRASLSIPANIAEGMSRSTPKDKLKFLNQAYSSAIEVLNFLIISFELNFISESQYKKSREALEKTTNQISALSKTIGQTI